MKNLFKKIDSFGTKFNFYTFAKPEFNTGFSSIVSIICYLIVLVLAISFGQDLYKRQNPKLQFFDLTPQNYSIIEINKTITQNFTIAFQIFSRNGPFDFTGILYPKIYYTQWTE